MSQKHRRSNREVKKPKQDKSKAVSPSSPFAASHANPVKRAVAEKRK
jgi:hypothetical protein